MRREKPHGHHTMRETSTGKPGILTAACLAAAGFLAMYGVLSGHAASGPPLPLGAILLGAFADRKGRRAGLLLALALISAGSLVAGAGIAAPLHALARAMQGFAAGLILGGIPVSLAEIAPHRRRGLYTACHAAALQCAAIFAALPDRRLTLLAGCCLVPLLLLLRSPATVEPPPLRARPSAREIAASLARNWRILLAASMLAAMTAVSFYLIAVWVPAFGQSVLHLAPREVWIVALCAAISSLVWPLLTGAWSDRAGRRPVLLVFTVLALLTAYPILSWLVWSPSFARLLVAALFLAFLGGGYGGAMTVHVVELMPPEIRASGCSLALSLAIVVFGGATPSISAYLNQATGNLAMPGVWLSLAAGAGLAAALAARRRGPLTAPT